MLTYTLPDGMPESVHDGLTMLRRTLSALCLFSLLLGCEPWIDEPDPGHGIYYLENQTGALLLVEATSPWGDELTLTNREVPAGETREIYSIVNDGHLFPSNAFGTFEVYRGAVSDTTRVYSGVNDHEWEERYPDTEGDPPDGLALTLSIQDATVL